MTSKEVKKRELLSDFLLYLLTMIAFFAVTGVSLERIFNAPQSFGVDHILE
jgi:hypothetical protein